MYYPVAVEGALVSMGDAHSAQGDSEFDGQSAAAAAAVTALCMSSHACAQCRLYMLPCNMLIAHTECKLTAVKLVATFCCRHGH